MSERLTAEQRERWDKWIKETSPWPGYHSWMSNALAHAVDAELRALRAELAQAGRWQRRWKKAFKMVWIWSRS